jgi:hypothetical protein
MAQNIHYEIFRRRGVSGGWSLVEVRDRRDDAIAYAQSLITGAAVGIKVIKETYNEDTGDYLSLKIFEHGEKKVKSKLLQDDLPASVCFKVDDLYSYHARKTIALLLPDFLSRNRVTVTELGHRADLLERLEATGTVLQHAIQRIAVAQAASGENQLTKIIRSLHDLTTQAIHRVYRDAEKKRFITAKPGLFLPLAEKLAGNTLEGAYLLNGSLALYLKDASGWDEKVSRLMVLMAEALGESAGAKLLFECIDNLISEILNGPASLRELIGAKDNHGKALMALIRLFLGREPEEGEGREGLSALTKQFAADNLTNARIAIAQRILTEIKSFKRLCPDSVEDEFKALRQIANMLVMGIGKYLSHEDLIAAFVLRSQRLINNEALAPYLSNITPEIKLERILFVEENVIGADNKRRLIDFITPVLSGSLFEEYFQNLKQPLSLRLQTLASLQDRVRRSGFQENPKAEIADAIDKVAASVEARGRLFESIDRRQADLSEKMAMVLKLADAAILTEPRMTIRARQLAMNYLSQPGFMTKYVAKAADRDSAIAGLLAGLSKLGIPAEIALKAMAA